eukprot:354241-Chlamydomonas_euryale.AAC.2
MALHGACTCVHGAAWRCMARARVCMALHGAAWLCGTLLKSVSAWARVFILHGTLPWHLGVDSRSSVSPPGGRT